MKSNFWGISILVMVGTLFLIIYQGFYLENPTETSQNYVTKSEGNEPTEKNTQTNTIMPKKNQTTLTPQKNNHPVSNIQQNRFKNASDFYQSLRWSIRNWHEDKGYKTLESLNNYEGPENYKGSHPYGYLSEQQIKDLAKNHDPDAQYIYAAYYLRNSPDESISLLKEIVINTEKTAPLINLGTQLLNKVKQSDPSNTDLENEGLAYFMLMKKRNDPMGVSMLNTMGFNKYSNERQREIEKISNNLLANLNNERSQRGLTSYSDQAPDIAKSMGMTDEELLTAQKLPMDEGLFEVLKFD